MTILYSSVSLDPICGMLLTESQVVTTYQYIGQTYRFCCIDCRNLFASAPEQYTVLLAHEREGHCGYPCPQQRTARN